MVNDMKISNLRILLFCVLFIFCAKLNVFSQENAVENAPPATENVAPAENTPAKLTPEMLVADQKRVAENYQRFDEILLRMSELMSVTDPDRGALLARVITQSREKMVRMRFDAVTELLTENAIARAQDNQRELYEDLKSLLVLLENESRGQKIKDEKERLRTYLKEVNQLIREERSLQGRTENAADVQKLTGEQHEIARKTGELARKMDAENQDANSPLNPGKDDDGASGEKKNGEAGKENENGKSGEKESPDANAGEGKSPDAPGGEKTPGGENPKGENGQNEAGENKAGENAEGKSGESGKSGKSGKSGESGESGESGGESGESGDSDKNKEDSERPKTPQDRLREAQKRMEEAQKKLEKAEKEGAVNEQEKAIRELEEAKAELEEILRQIREEEAKRYLTLLETRLKKMQQMQRTVYEDTLRLAKIPENDRTHDHTVESTRLSRRESDIVLEADKTLLLLREDGTAVALPGVLSQARDDMQRVTLLLGKGDVSPLTQSVEEDILAALEEMIAAVEKALKDLDDEEKKMEMQQQSMADQDPALIDLLTEIKMIRSTQLRINNRTQRIGKLITGESAEKPDLMEMLKDLSRQQAAIRQITRDIATGKND